MKISSCDLFVYVGGESDEWVEDALKEATNKDMIVINLLDVLGDKVKEEEVVEGMQGEDDDHEDHDEDHDQHPHDQQLLFLVHVLDHPALEQVQRHRGRGRQHQG